MTRGRRGDETRPQVVVLICADAEWEAALDHFNPEALAPSPFGGWFVVGVAGTKGRPTVFLHTGWGKVSAAAATQYVVDRWAPALLVNLGTCGGFEGAVDAGDVVLAERTVIYDIVEQMGDPAAAIAHYSTTIDLEWLGGRAPAGARRATLVSADRDLRSEDIARLEREHGAVAADWESGAIAFMARRNATRLLILRVVSDLVGLRGGEAYGALALFRERTRAGMTRLLQELPAWLDSAL